jgi:D-alanyl-D-alanine dipeptidase
MINQITKTLSRSAWQKVVVHENNESLVEVKETARLKIGLVSKRCQPSFYVRQTVAEKLLKVSENLPKGINLVLIEGYRNLKSQQEFWDMKFQKLKQENPSWIDEQIEQQVRLVAAKPSPLANHHCGGAIDVTLAYSDGTLLDCGTPYPSEAMSADWYKKFQMLSNEITDEQKANRKILRFAMETEDFVWYPGEWWHYCWGDRMWAVYSNQTECFYGPAYLQIPY